LQNQINFTRATLNQSLRLPCWLQAAAPCLPGPGRRCEAAWQQRRHPGRQAAQRGTQGRHLGGAPGGLAPTRYGGAASAQRTVERRTAVGGSGRDALR